MSKKQEFIEFIEPFINENFSKMSENCKSYWNAFTTVEEKEKPPFTENGRMILKFLQEHSNDSAWKSKDIAEHLGISSRSVAGSIRKLVNDNFVDKVGENPIFYTLTESGKNIELGE